MLHFESFDLSLLYFLRCRVRYFLVILGLFRGGIVGSHCLSSRLHVGRVVRVCGWASVMGLQVKSLITCRLDCGSRWGGEDEAAVDVFVQWSRCVTMNEQPCQYPWIGCACRGNVFSVFPF